MDANCQINNNSKLMIPLPLVNNEIKLTLTPPQAAPLFFEVTGDRINSKALLLGTSYNKSFDEYPEQVVQEIKSCELLVTDMRQNMLGNDPVLLRRKGYHQILKVLYNKFLQENDPTFWFREQFGKLGYSNGEIITAFTKLEQAKRNYLGLRLGEEDIEKLISELELEPTPELRSMIKENQKGNEDTWYNQLGARALTYVNNLLGSLDLNVNSTHPIMVEDLLMQVIDTRDFPDTPVNRSILEHFIEQGKKVCELGSFDLDVTSQLATFIEVVSEFDVSETVTDIEDFVRQIESEEYSDDGIPSQYEIWCQKGVSQQDLEGAKGIDRGTQLIQEAYMEKIWNALDQGKSVAIVLPYSALLGSSGVLSSFNSKGLTIKSRGVIEV